ncbi:hypothetical protein CHLRE_10g451477v5 [Chlamydomonas reinhardtii]|uniref:Uncharacterized protein n=1 Tax=Chlamydomonas reinhardtii TaxID=3055 RepID=A0A2K3DB75_CHLRE|nr:uncharacterized protein CHLRE_10g451477v5 [Chlamydomonas reinhardtii]PNW77781.1 hypothetical protein CHLRE_10g451477v5 [Chlamydomonas reinhardtii]
MRPGWPAAQPVPPTLAGPAGGGRCKRGDLAALRWLHRRGLLDGPSVSWLAGRVELGAAPAAGGTEH